MSYPIFPHHPSVRKDIWGEEVTKCSLLLLGISQTLKCRMGCRNPPELTPFQISFLPPMALPFQYLPHCFIVISGQIQWYF